MNCSFHQNVIEVMIYKFQRLNLKRTCNFHSCLLENLRPSSRQKPRVAYSRIGSHMEESQSILSTNSHHQLSDMRVIPSGTLPTPVSCHWAEWAQARPEEETLTWSIHKIKKIINHWCFKTLNFGVFFFLEQWITETTSNRSFGLCL